MNARDTIPRQPGATRGFRASRVVLCGAGIVLLGWGFVLLVPVLMRDPLSAGGWLVAGPVIHDTVVGVCIVGAATLLRRWLPDPWRALVAAGLVLTGVILALSVPLWWRAHAGHLNPGVRTEVWPGVLALLGIVWVVVAAIGTLATVHRHWTGRDEVREARRRQ